MSHSVIYSLRFCSRMSKLLLSAFRPTEQDEYTAFNRDRLSRSAFSSVDTGRVEVITYLSMNCTKGMFLRVSKPLRTN